MEFWRNHKTIFITGGIITLVLGILAALAYQFFTGYHVTTTYVDGNTHYSDEQICEMVMDGLLGDNSLFLSLKYKNRSIEDVPFISKMAVEVLDKHTIRINVYEKATAGYVEYLEKFMYFDKDGIVIEASDQKTKEVPLITGLDFDHVRIHEMLPVENPEIFESILSLTQLVNKYNLQVDKIYFAKDNEITLHFGEVKVLLGQPQDLDEKVMKLQYILPELEGKSGTIRLENYTEETKSISFEPD